MKLEYLKSLTAPQDFHFHLEHHHIRLLVVFELLVVLYNCTPEPVISDTTILTENFYLVTNLVHRIIPRLTFKKDVHFFVVFRSEDCGRSVNTLWTDDLRIRCDETYRGWRFRMGIAPLTSWLWWNHLTIIFFCPLLSSYVVNSMKNHTNNNLMCGARNN